MRNHFNPNIRVYRYISQLVVLFFTCAIQNVVFAAQHFSQQDVLHDFDELYQSLIDTHYDPFAYTPESEFQSHFKALRATINEPSYGKKDVVTLFQQLVSQLQNGHTEIEFPIDAYFAYVESGGTLFPLDLAFEEGKALVRANYSNQATLSAGTELHSINGVSMDKILSSIGRQISAERTYFERTKIEVYAFPRLYWQVYGEQKHFDIEVLKEGKLVSLAVNAIPAIEGFEMQREEVLDGTREITFLGEVAYLRPGHFSGNLNEFKMFIDDAFDDVKKANARELVIDIRNNGGGDDAFSDYVISYFADKPFKWYSRFSLRTSERLKHDTRLNRDTSQPYWASILAHPNGKRYAFDFDAYQPQPKDRRFTGRVWVLINRHSHSQAAVTAATIQDYLWGTIVGEESGDYPSLYASVFHYPLPKTQITVRIAKGHIIRPNGSEQERGVLPDILVRDHLLDESDEILGATLSHIVNSPRP